MNASGNGLDGAAHLKGAATNGPPVADQPDADMPEVERAEPAENAEAAAPGAGWSVNRLARELRLDRRTVHKRLLLHNVPAVAEGPKGALYDLADAARAIFGSTSLTETEELQRRVLQAKAEGAELDLAAKRGELVRAEAVRKAAAANARIERDALLNWPDRIAPTLAAALGVDQARLTAALEREVRAFMEDRAKDDGHGL